MADPAMVVAVGVMVGVYALVALERMHRTTATLAGVGVLLMVQFLVAPFFPSLELWHAAEDAEGHAAGALFDSILSSVDWNVVLLLFGMMVIVAILEKTGIFQFLAFKAYEFARGRIVVLMAVMMLITAVTSAFLDNVTTMLLMAPVVLEIALVLGVSPVGLLLPMVFASNVGGAATLIGDPPNILVGSAAGLTFTDFIVSLTPAVVPALVVLFGTSYWLNRKLYHHSVEDLEPTLRRLRSEYAIHDWRPVRVSLAVLAFVILLFFLHGVLEMEVSLAALIGAAILLTVSRANIVRVLEEIEWPTLIFFLFLFIIVGAVEQTGFLDLVADGIVSASGGSFVLTLVLLVWVSAIVSSIVDNIPYVATMIPVVAELTASFEPTGVPVIGLWWALVLGADFGGNATVVGASANIVTVGIAERAGQQIGFLEFMKEGIPVMLTTCLVATVYLVIVYGGVL